MENSKSKNLSNVHPEKIQVNSIVGYKANVKEVPDAVWKLVMAVFPGDERLQDVTHLK